MNDPEIYLTFSDDGIHVMCERDECRVDPRYWFVSSELPYKLTAEVAADAIRSHVATHNR